LFATLKDTDTDIRSDIAKPAWRNSFSDHESEYTWVLAMFTTVVDVFDVGF